MLGDREPDCTVNAATDHVQRQFVSIGSSSLVIKVPHSPRVKCQGRQYLEVPLK